MSYENRVLRDNNFDGQLNVKPKQRTKLTDIKRENAYNNIINTIGWKRFKWTLPKNINLSSDEIERAVCCGAACVFRVPEWSGSASAGMWVASPVEWVGVRKADNTADSFITYLPDKDFSITKEQLTEYAIIRNNFEMFADYDFTEWTAQMLSETDISELQLIKWSRMTPIAKVQSMADIGKFEDVLRRVYNGEPWAVLSDFTKIMTGSPTSRDDTVLRLTDETAIEKMHFLSEFHYELIRRLCNLYNIPFRTTAKSAQNLESELHNTDIFSRMLTDDGLRWREMSISNSVYDGAKPLNELFDGECRVEIGDLFKKENEVIENGIDSTKPENKNVSHETIDGTNAGDSDE